MSAGPVEPVRGDRDPGSIEMHDMSPEEEAAAEERINDGYESVAAALDAAAREQTERLRETTERYSNDEAATERNNQRISREADNQRSAYGPAPSKPGAPASEPPVANQYQSAWLNLEGNRNGAQQSASNGYRQRCGMNKYALTGGLVVGAAGITSLVLYLTGQFDAANPPPPKDPPDPPDSDLPPDFPETMQEIVAAWNALEEKAFWTAVLDWLKTDPQPSIATQRDFVSYARSLATVTGMPTDQFIVDTVNSLTDVWNKAGVKPDEVPLTADENLARHTTLYTSISTLAGEDEKELPRYWKLRILEFILAGIATPARLIDNEPLPDDKTNDTFTTVGEWKTQASEKERETISRNYRFATKDDPGTKTAIFTVNDLEPGDYEVSATWLPANSNADDTPFRMLDAVDGTELARVLVNQQPAPDDFEDYRVNWKKVAIVNIPGKTLVVEISNDVDNGRVVADAILVKSAVTVPK